MKAGLLYLRNPGRTAHLPIFLYKRGERARDFNPNSIDDPFQSLTLHQTVYGSRRVKPRS
jgi:hypothetical protein